MSQKIFEISKSDGRLKRIEYRGKYLRASRTGGVSLRAQGKAAGVNFTVNSKHGTRVSTRVGKGTNVGFQNGHFVLRGRYGKGPTKINLSKSGFSVSSKTEVGTINWIKPRYSSAKIGGVQFRGKNALIIHGITALFQIFYYTFTLAFQVVSWLFKTAIWLTELLFKSTFLIFKKLSEIPLHHKQRRIKVFEEKWLEEYKDLSEENLVCALFYILVVIARGESKVSSGFINALLDSFEEKDQLKPIIRKISDENIETVIHLIFNSINEENIDQIILIKSLFGSIAEVLSQKMNADILIILFWALDFSVLVDDKRNTLQEELLGVFADASGIETII